MAKPPKRGTTEEERFKEKKGPAENLQKELTSSIHCRQTKRKFMENSLGAGTKTIGRKKNGESGPMWKIGKDDRWIGK